MEAEGRRQFRIGRCLGRGGFGEVYRATMRAPGGLETVVALKVLRSDLELTDDLVRRLRDEGRLLARISHPAVVRAHDLTRIEQRLALVTELVEGEDLEDVIRGEGRIPPRALLEVVAQLAVALDAAYQTPGPDGRPLAVVHRDLKPRNVRVGRHGQVKLLDFGIARFTAGDREARTRTGLVVGSLAYMAPERFREHTEPAPPCDVFGLGCVLYEGLTGRRFHEEQQLKVVSATSLDPTRYEVFLRDRLEPVEDRELRALLARCLAYEAPARPTAKVLAAELEALAERASGPTLRRWCAERRWAEPAKVDGSTLEGLTVTEGTLGLGSEPPAAPVAPVVREPARHTRAVGTIDPAIFDDGPAPEVVPPRASPRAPPAFPSIPLGIALDDGLLSKDELNAILAPTPPPAPRRDRTPVVLASLGCVGLGVLGVGAGALVFGIAALGWLFL